MSNSECACFFGYIIFEHRVDVSLAVQHAYYEESIVSNNIVNADGRESVDRPGSQTRQPWILEHLRLPDSRPLANLL
jgi:hypothetical protein